MLAAALFAGPLLESAHEASVRHIACPEDGELIDAPAQPIHAHAHAGSDGAQLFSEREQPASPFGGDHDHCAVALRGHVRAREASAARLTISLDAVVRSALPTALPVISRGISLYRLAPKSGPPQA
jgi:hypothetical protein